MPFSLGLSGTLRNYTYGTVGTNVNLNQSAEGQAMALDALIPVIPSDTGDGPSLVLTGEWTVGKGDGDEMFLYSGGLPALSTTTNGINLDSGVGGFNGAGNFTLVDIKSYNGQVQFHLPKNLGTYLTVGYGEVFSDNIGGLTGGGATASKLYNDDSVMFANLMHDFNANIRAGVEYDRFDTHYVTGAVGTGSGSDAIDHRVMVSSWYRF